MTAKLDFKTRMETQVRYLKYCEKLLGIPIELNLQQMYRFAELWKKHYPNYRINKVNPIQE